jgi:hypothetical protein
VDIIVATQRTKIYAPKIRLRAEKYPNLPIKLTIGDARTRHFTIIEEEVAIIVDADGTMGEKKRC